MPEAPTFKLLSQKLPADTLGLKLLGRTVENTNLPTAGYRPEDPREFITQEPVEVEDTNATLYYNSVNEGNAKGQLGQLFELSSSKEKSFEAQLEGKKIITRILPQHRDVFKAIYPNYKTEIDELLKENGGVGYMVVGYKSVLDGTLTVQRKEGSTKAGRAQLPVGVITSVATQGAVNLGTTADPSLEGGQIVAAEWLARNQLEGEQIFAIQYRDVALIKDGKRWSSIETAKLKQIHVVESGEAVYGENDTEEGAMEVVYDDEDEELSEDEEQNWAAELV